MESEEYATNAARLRNYGALRPRLAAALAAWNAEDLRAALEEAGIAYGITRDHASVAGDPSPTLSAARRRAARRRPVA